MPTIAEALQIAIQQHQAGNLQAAEQIYRQILLIEPNHFDATHYLGVMAAQLGKQDVAERFIRRATILKPNFAEAHHNLGVALSEQRKLDEAVECYRRALELNSEYPEAHHNLGIALRRQGKLDQAVACYRRAVGLKPNYPEAHHSLGIALSEQKKLDEAVDCYRRALELNSEFTEAHYNLGNAFLELEKWDEAIASYRRATILMPNIAEAHHNLGIAFSGQKKLEEAIACYHRALELNPDCAEAHFNLGIALADQGKWDEAIACYHRALALQPNFAEVFNNLGNASKELGNLAEALQYYRQATELQADYADAHSNLSTVLLLLGMFQPGWQEYEWRWQSKELKKHPPNYSQPIWDGSNLAGKTLLLRPEQGLGDTFQFIRYGSILQKLGAKVVFHCPRVLSRLLKLCPAIDHLTTEDSPLPHFDYYIPLLSLPRVFKTELHNIPANIPYLFAEPILVKSWQSTLTEFSGFRIGINWHGREGQGQWQRRDLPLAFFSRLAQLPGLQLFSLQKGTISPQEQSLLDQARIISFGDNLDNTNGPFMDTAAIMKNLDLVITSDTSIAHLAGALGVPVWVALPSVPDWRWLLAREDSPWYPTMRLFRQTKRDDWSDVFERMKRDLISVISK